MARAGTAAWGLVLLCLASCQGGSTGDASGGTPDPAIDAEIVQLRSDEPLERVEVAVRNGGAQDIRVVRLRLTIPGFQTPPAIAKDSPVPASQVVNLPVPYGAVACPSDGPPQIGTPRVTLDVQVGTESATRQVRFAAGDGDGLLQRIATRACAVEQIQRQVDLRFMDRWRLERTPDGDQLHGTLRATLLAGGPRTLSQVSGAIMYGLRPDATASDPLALLTPARPDARIPVVTYAQRCDAHTKGEIKKPYEFLVWVSTSGGDSLAVTPTVDDATKVALRQVCAF